MTYSLIEKKCPCCGRIYVPAPYHVFKQYCSWTCYNKSVYLSKQNKQVKGRAVNQYDREGNYIATFPSIKKASEQTGISYDTIRIICNGTTKTPHRYVFKYV